MAREWSASGHYIDCAAGGVVPFAGGLTLAAFVRRTGGSRIMSILDAGSNAITFYYNTGFGAFINATRTPASAITLTAGQWYLVAVTKSGGTSLPTFHAYDVAAGTWARSIASSTSTFTPTWTPAVLRIGNGSGATPSQGWEGSIAAAGVWNRPLSDAELDRLPYSVAPWLASGPSAMWLLDQADTAVPVRDLTGGGANQTVLTGTAVSAWSVPVLSYGHPIITATRDSGGGGGDHVTSGTARAVATATAAVTTDRPTAGAASALAGATAAVSTTRTTTGTGRAVASASATSSKQAATAGTARAFAAATAAVSTDRYTTGTARAVAAATAVVSRPGEHTTAGTARAVATASAVIATDRITAGAARAVAAAQAAHTTTRATAGAAPALATAPATVTTDRTTAGVARAVATARAVTSQSGRTVVRPNTGTVTRPYTGVVTY